MYKIIGSDGKEYGPVTVDQIREWLAENRVNAKTRVIAEGTNQWKALAEFPELASPVAMNSTSPPIYRSGMTAGKVAGDQLSGPSTGLIVTGILGLVLQALVFLGNVLGISQGFQEANPDAAALNFLSGTVGIALNVVGVVIGVLILVGALKMKRLESHKWGMAASILALAPCISPCCLLGLPMGIWSLVVLAKPEVKGAFH